MGVFFHDTSAILKRYLKEPGSGWVQTLTDPATGHFHYLARITLPEAVSAITRRERGGQIAAADALTAIAQFRSDFARQYRIAELSASLIDRAALLARTHGLRGYDAVQLATALAVRDLAPTLVLHSADIELNAAAAALGLAVEDPNDYP